MHLLPKAANLHEHEIDRVDGLIKRIIQASTNKITVAHALPPLLVLKDRFSYDAGTGLIYHALVGKKIYGKVAGGRTKKGYIGLEISVDGVRIRLYAHRVAWALHYGDSPPPNMAVDHLDGDRRNNKISNLELVTTHSNNYRISADVLGGSGRMGWEARQQKARSAY